MMKRVLITGGTGTISSGLASEFAENNYIVTCVTRGNLKWREQSGIKYEYCDVNNIEQMASLFPDVHFDVVIDCLAYSLEELKNHLQFFTGRCEKYVFISTTAIYKREKGVYIKEDSYSELMDWSYAGNKIICEKYLIEWASEKDLDYLIIRPPVVYGDYRVPFPVITRRNQWMIYKRMIDGKPILNNNIDPVKYCILHISDFSTAVRLLIENPAVNRDCFHISAPNSLLDWDDVLRAAGEILECDLRIIHVGLSAFVKTFSTIYEELKWNKNEDLLLDSEKLFKTTHFMAKKELKEGIESNIKSLKNEFENYNKYVDYEFDIASDQTIFIGLNTDCIKEEDVSTAREYLRCLGDTRGI